MTKLFTFVLLLAPCIAQAQTTVAGSTPGSFRVTESGAAEYRIPIRVPPGIAGMEPRLALVYNSQAGNGLLGVGWDLEGLSAIGRCPRTLAQDGVRGSVNYDANDRFCLDGQRLMAISGTYGADGTEYRTERESFNKVISYGVAGNGPAWFKAWTKSGQIIEYGNTADSRVEAQGKATVRVWAQNKISDTKGNYLTVTYIEDSPNGDYRPDRIDYTGNAGTALAPASSVRFVYESRSDVTPFYQAGALIRQTHRTVAIEAWIGSSQSGRYALAYDNLGAAGMSRVTGVAHCDALGACMPAHQLAWATVASFNNFSIKPNLVGEDGYYMGYTPYIGDFNGDGKADVLWDFKFSGSDMRSGGYRVLWLGNGDGTFSVITNLAGGNGVYMGYTPYIGDFNGDGKADVLWDYKFGGSDMRSGGYRYLWLGNGDGTFSVISNLAGGNGSYMGYTPYVGDFNGDGKADVLWDYKFSGSDMRSGGYRYLWLGNGDGTFAVISNLVGANGSYMGYTPYIGDFNGDGKADVLWDYKFSGSDMRSGGYRYLWLGNGDGTFSVISNLAGADGSFMGYTPYIGDFNGDGKADVLWDYKFSGSDMRSGGYRYLWLGKGDGTFTINSNVASADGGLMGYEPSIADFNGDGKADVLWDYKFSGSDMRSGGYRYLWLGKGDATFTINSNAAGVDVAYMGYEPSIADFDGDGKSDVLWNYLFSGADLRSGGYRNLWMQAGGLTDVITSFQNGLGAGTSIAYKSLTDPAVYTKDSGAVYPDMDLQMPMQVVYGAETSDGSGGTTAISKKYGGGRARLDGRGFLGFRWIEALQVETGLKVRSEFRQDWPYVGLPSVVKKTQTSGSVLSEATNTFSCINPATGSACAVAAGNRYFPFTSQSVESGNDLNGAALPTVTTTTAYDNFGNATSVVVSTGDGYSKTTTNTFANDVANWFLGRLTRSTVQSVTP